MIKNLKFTAVLGAAIAVFGLSSGQAQASYSCSGNGFSNYASSYGSYGACDGTDTQASTVTTSTAVLATAASASAKLVSSRVSDAIGGAGGVNVAANGFSASTGASAGGHTGQVGAWVSGSWSNLEDDNTDTAFEGDVFNVMGGVDYRITPKAVVGIAVGYEDLDIDTEYNGFGGNNGQLEGDGYTIAPYIGGEIAPDVTANLTVGYSDIEYDTVRFDPLTGNRITGSTDADRYFVNASVAGDHMIDSNWRLRGKTAIFYANEDKDAFTETEAANAALSTAQTQISQADSDTDFGQISVDAKLGYVFDMVEPYALVGLDFDYAKDEAPVAAGETRGSLDDEDFGARFGAGVDFNLGHNVKAGIEGYTVEFRDDYNEYTVTGGLRVEF